MGLVEHDDVIQTLPSDGVDQAFHERRLPRRAVPNYDFLDTYVLDAQSEVPAVDAVTVVKQKARRFIVREVFHDLLRSPPSGRMSRDIEVDDPPSVMPKD